MKELNKLYESLVLNKKPNKVDKLYESLVLKEALAVLKFTDSTTAKQAGEVLKDNRHSSKIQFKQMQSNLVFNNEKDKNDAKQWLSDYGMKGLSSQSFKKESFKEARGYSLNEIQTALVDAGWSMPQTTRIVSQIVKKYGK